MEIRSWCLFFLALILCSCTPELSKPQPQSFSQEDLPSCASRDCPKIAIDYVSYTPHTLRETRLNTAVNSFIATSLYLEDPSKPPLALTIEEAAKGFVASYWRDHAEFPDLDAEYFIESSVQETHRDTRLLTLEFKQYKYTGGAHGHQDVSYVNFNIKTGERLPSQVLFKEYNALRNHAEIAFRKKFNISPQSSINEHYFWFNDNTFTMPNSLGFSQDSLVLHYNQHEIASYIDTPIVLKISISEVEEFLK